MLATSKVISAWILTVTVDIHDDFIVLPHWETRLPSPLSDFPFTHIILILC